jgi:hypothetical protein
MALTVKNVDSIIIDDPVDSSAVMAFHASFKMAVADVIAISPDDITVGTISSGSDSGSLGRWLQGRMDIVVSFTIDVNSERLQFVTQRISKLRLDESSITMDGNRTALAATLEDSVIKSASVGITCREGHDPTSPLCHVCLAGFMEGMDQMCTACEDQTVEWVRVVGLSVAVVAGCLVVGLAYHLYRTLAARGAKKDAAQLRWVKPNFSSGGAAPLSIYSKICISHYQVLPSPIATTPSR